MKNAWDNIQTESQRETLIKACVKELERLRKSPKVKEILKERMEIKNEQGDSSILIDRDGIVFWHYSYRDDDGLNWRDSYLTPYGVLDYEMASKAFADGKILPWDIKKARGEIER